MKLRLWTSGRPETKRDPEDGAVALHSEKVISRETYPDSFNALISQVKVSCSLQGISRLACENFFSGLMGIAQSCLTLCDCSPPVSSIHGTFQARILEWVAISSSRGSSRPREQVCVSCISCIVAGKFITAEPPD